MSQGTFSGLLTAFLFVTFIVGVIWAYSSKRKAEFDAAARLPLEDGPAPHGTAQRKSENAP
ncbi:MAG: cbb3-type cytochrome c oxidase subunit 3 [Xanthomonadales bacterium]|nr:cbb3-type cytochrome c oxidase subunit 3 [Xanthomonadales bacterium]